MLSSGNCERVSLLLLHFSSHFLDRFCFALPVYVFYTCGSWQLQTSSAIVILISAPLLFSRWSRGRWQLSGWWPRSCSGPHKSIIPQLLVCYIIMVTIFIGSGSALLRPSQVPATLLELNQGKCWCFACLDRIRGTLFSFWNKMLFPLVSLRLVEVAPCHHQMSLLSSPRRNASNSNWNNADTSVLNMFACTFLYRPKFKTPISVDQTLVLTPQLLSLLC